MQQEKLKLNIMRIFTTAIILIASFVFGTTTWANDDIPTITVIDEDFSLFTAGSEDAPATTDLGTGSGYTIDAQYTKAAGWHGRGVWQAGGACALGTYESDYYGTSYGYISTPEMELYGELTVTFRARRTSDSSTQTLLYLALCDNDEGPVDSKDIYPSAEWTTYTFVTNKGTFNNRNLLQFAAEDGKILLDDIKVTRKRNTIPSPTANSPINMSPTEFVASWQPVAEAKSYLLDVYYKAMPEGEPVEGEMEEHFDGINATTDGKIDTANPNYPEGWVINLSSAGTQDLGTAEGTHLSGKQSLCFDAVGDVVTSPTAPAPLSFASFWIKPSVMDDDAYDMSLLGIEVIHGDGTTEHIANLPYYWLSEEGEYYDISSDDLGENAVAIRLWMEQKGKVNFYVDDFSYEYATQAVNTPLLEGEELTDTFRVVSGIDPAKDYYYYVRAKEANLISTASSTIWVDGLVGMKPQGNPATEVEATAFTANWEAIPHAQNYNVDLYKVLTTTQNDEKVQLLKEDFGLAEGGTMENPNSPSGWTMTSNLAEEGVTHTQWTGIYAVWTDGKVGGRAGSDWSRGGLLATPALPLGDGGDVDVTVTAHNMKAGDTLVVAIMDSPSALYGIAAIEIPFSKDATDDVTTTVTFDADFVKTYLEKGNGYHVAFMTTERGAFFLDEVKVEQVRQAAGETVYAPYGFATTEDNSCRFDNLETDTRYAFCVTAYATKDYQNYQSDQSDAVEVPLGTTSIRRMLASKDNACPAFYNLSGQRINATSITKGVVVVKDAKGVRKIVNK